MPLDNEELFVRARLRGGPADGHELIVAKTDLPEQITVPTGLRPVGDDPLDSDCLGSSYVAPSSITGTAFYLAGGLLTPAVGMVIVVYHHTRTEPSID